MTIAQELTQMTKDLRMANDGVDRIIAERDHLKAENAALLEKVGALRFCLGGLRATFSIIHDRHEDEQDCDQEADGYPRPNSAMSTVVDCNAAIGEIRRVMWQPLQTRGCECPPEGTPCPCILNPTK